MKLFRKSAALLICIMMIVPALALPAAQAVHWGLGETLEEVGNVDVSYVTEDNPVVIDGVLDEWDNLMYDVEDKNLCGAQHSYFMPYYTDGTYQIGFKYDAERIYVAAVIVDKEFKVSTRADSSHGGNGDAFGINFDPRQSLRYDYRNGGGANRYWVYCTENNDETLNFCMYRGNSASDEYTHHRYGQKKGDCYYVGDPNGKVGKVTVSDTEYIEGTTIVKKEGNLNPENEISGKVTRTKDRLGNDVITYEFCMGWDIIISDNDAEAWYSGHVDDYVMGKEYTTVDKNGDTMYCIDPSTGDYYLDGSGNKVVYTGWVEQEAQRDCILLGNGEVRYYENSKLPVRNGCEICYWDASYQTTFFTSREEYFRHESTNTGENCGVFLNMDYAGHKDDPDNSFNLHHGKWVVTKEPTITERGVESYVCSICGKTIEVRNTDKLHKYTESEKLGENFITHNASSFGFAPYTYYDDLSDKDNKTEIKNDTIVLNTGADTTGILSGGSCFAQTGVTTKGLVKYDNASVEFKAGNGFRFKGDASTRKMEGSISFAWASGYGSYDEIKDLYYTDGVQSVFITTNDLYSGREESNTLGSHSQRYRQSPIWEYDAGNNYMGNTYLPGGLTRQLVLSHGGAVEVTLYPEDLEEGRESTLAGKYEVSILRRGNYRAEVVAMGNLDNPVDVTKPTYIGLERDESEGLCFVIRNSDGSNVNKVGGGEAAGLDTYEELYGISSFGSDPGYGIMAFSVIGPEKGNATVTVNKFAGEPAANFGSSGYVADIEEAIAALPGVNSGYDTVKAAEEDINAVKDMMANNPYGEWISDGARQKLKTLNSILKAGPVQNNPFKDVKSTDYFYKAVLWAVNHKPNQITAGTSANTFSPNAGCTRGQVVTFLWRAAGEPVPESENNPFTDVKQNDYYYSAVFWAVENNITAGMSANTFGPSLTCTRAQVVTFLYRASGSPAIGSTVNKFTDIKSSDYFYNAVLWAVENNITSGMTANTFGPSLTCTRGQVVTFLYRYEAA